MAPKPKVAQKLKLRPPPVAPKPDGPSLCTSPETKRTKPPIAPKPCLSQNCSSSVQAPASKTGSSALTHEKLDTVNNVGLLNSRNCVRVGTKKPEWDYIIPICVCNRDSCLQCTPKENSKQAIITNGGDPTSCQLNGTSEGLKKPPIRRQNSPDKDLCAPDTKKDQLGKNTNGTCTKSPTILSDSNHLPRAPKPEQVGTVEKLINKLSACQRGVESRPKPTPPQVQRSKEINGDTQRPHSWAPVELSDSHGLPSVSTSTKNINLKDAPGRSPAIPAAPQKALPVPVPRKSWLILPGGLEVKDESRTSSNVDLSEKASADLNDSDDIYETVDADYVDLQEPVPALRKNFLHRPAQNGQRDRDYYESTEYSVDNDNDIEEEGEHSGSVFKPKQPKLSNPVTVARSKSSVHQWSPKPSQGRQLHPSYIFSPKIKREEQAAKDNQKCLSSTPPKDMDGKNKSSGKQVSNFSPGNTKGKRFGQGLIPRAKSFTSVDLLRPDGNKKITFRKFLDINISVKKLPKMLTKRGLVAECSSVDMEESVDADVEGEGSPTPVKAKPVAGARKFSCPIISTEQSVDGDEFFPGAEDAVEYENFPIYEDIPEYMNIPNSKAPAKTSAPSSTSERWPNASWTKSEESLYEEQEIYEPIGEYVDDVPEHNGYER